MAITDDIELIQGKTWSDLLRWELGGQVVYKPISTVIGLAPLRISVPAHGMVDGWRAAFTNVKGMVEVNATANAVRANEYHKATKIDADTLEFNDINAGGFKTYVPGSGHIQYNMPADLTGYNARMSVKAVQGESCLLVCSVGGVSGAAKPTAAGKEATGDVVWAATALPATKEWVAGATYTAGDVVDTKSLLALFPSNNRVVVNTALRTIARTIPASLIAAQTWTSGFYDFEAYSSDPEPVVVLLASGKITVANEQTK